ncbi:MAG TPA: PIG-L family deacetylase [Chthonomonadaceae bacterium]|nr:PIG-L family deacetylase [Chthonomonadaceae bacterium]
MSEKPLHILTLGAHAADQELSAGMVIAKATRVGHQATILSLTPGEKGHPRLDAQTYARQKIAEAEQCARLLGAQSRLLAYGDVTLPVNEEIIFEVADIIRALKPDVLITHPVHSIHKDHRNAHRIALDAVFYAALPRIERADPAHRIGRLFFSENWEDMEGYEPDIYIDTTEVFDQYCEALASFELWHGGTGWPYADYYRSLARMRGCLGFGLRGTYAATLARPKEARVLRSAGLPF